jgi:hypothetical protein
LINEVIGALYHRIEKEIFSLNFLKFIPIYSASKSRQSNGYLLAGKGR